MFSFLIESAVLTSSNSILEYLSRDDAERAVRDLTGKTVRGRDVKVVSASIFLLGCLLTALFPRHLMMVYVNLHIPFLCADLRFVDPWRWRS